MEAGKSDRIGDGLHRSMWFAWSASFILFLGLVLHCGVPAAFGQTATTGALSGIVTDPSEAVVAGALIKITNEATGVTRTALSGENGSYLVPLLPPGAYHVEISKTGFKVSVYDHIQIHVTEAASLNIRLGIGSSTETVTIFMQATELETTSSALGHVTDERMVASLPLVTRNYTQILGLSPGVSGETNNAAGVGRGSTSNGVGSGGYSVSGNTTNDNNFLMNGTQVNDLMGSGNNSGGVPVPNPDSIQEFKVQTGQYDASYGRNAGANVDVVTKSGTHQYHGDVWEYFRNTALNANDFFLNRSGAPRGVLNQNQFGFTFGGPAVKDKVFFFTSYQGTREKDGLDTVTGCLSSGFLPVGLTNNPNDRTAAGLFAIYGGQSGLFGTITSPSDISPMALALLNAKLPNGQFVVPAPQNATTGFTAISSPCIYNDDQFIINLDVNPTEKSHFSGKFFFSDNSLVAALPRSAGQIGGSLSMPGFPRITDQGFRDFSLTHTYVFNTHFLNQAVLGFARTTSRFAQVYPSVTFANSQGCATGAFTLASICVPAPSFDNSFPGVNLINGGFGVGGNGQGVGHFQNGYDFRDSITYVLGKHSLHFGGGITRSQINFLGFHFLAALDFATFPDVLMGNALLSLDAPGLFDRAWRVRNGDFYLQDNYQVLPRLTLSLGLRYERQGGFGDEFGRSSTFNPAVANPNPPAGGALQGYVVASNFRGTVPAGVTQAGTTSAINNDGANAWAPRVGFAWQLPGTNRLALRGGYGIYYSRTVGQPWLQLLTNPPFGSIRVIPAVTPATAFPAFPALPFFSPYSPATQLTPTIFSLHFRPPVVQQYSMNLQASLPGNLLLEVGYRGSRGTKLLEERAFNQALSASATDPIRGQTSNTLANVPLRVPIEGFDTSQAIMIESAGASWYNAMTVSLSKRLSHGLQFLASYTWASALETNPGYATGANGGVLAGDQNSHIANYGFDPFVRPQRLVVSYVYDLPSPQHRASLVGRVLADWSLAGVTTFQSGQRLTITDSSHLNAFNIFGDNPTDRVQLVSGCTIATPGSVSSRLDKFFNGSCFAAPPVIGSDGFATAFGNGGIGIVRGPDQQDFDISIIKKIRLGQMETRSIEFRTEFFNAFNHPSFANPGLSAGTATCIVNSSVSGTPCTRLSTGPATPQFVIRATPATFGKITSTSVNARIIQFALKLYF